LFAYCSAEERQSSAEFPLPCRIEGFRIFPARDRVAHLVAVHGQQGVVVVRIELDADLLQTPQQRIPVLLQGRQLGINPRLLVSVPAVLARQRVPFISLGIEPVSLATGEFPSTAVQLTVMDLLQLKLEIREQWRPGVVDVYCMQQ